MRVSCTTNRSARVARRRLARGDSADYGGETLRVGATSCVVAMLIDGFLDDTVEIITSDSIYPWPLSFFAVIDGRISRYWEIGVRETHHGAFYVLGYPELVRDPMFLTELIDTSDGVALEVHRRWTIRLDREFTLPELGAAPVLRDRWVQCPACADAWEVLDDAGVIVCPTCSGKFNSPFAPESP